MPGAAEVGSNESMVWPSSFNERGTFSSGSPSLRTTARIVPGRMESMVSRVCTKVRGHILSVISSS